MNESIAIKELLDKSTLPRTETEILLSHLLGQDRSYLHAHPQEVINNNLAQKFQDLLTRRQNHEPLQYLTNKQEFYGLEFYVNSNVLIPRPETEGLVEETLKHYFRNPSREHGRGFHPFPQKYRILDVGTGCGNIAVTLAKNLPKVEIFALDLSKEALEVAKINAQKHAVLNKIQFLHGHLLGPYINLHPRGEVVPTPQVQTVDLIVANLPYIAEHIYQGLEPHIREYEPKMALVGGETCLELYKELFKQSSLVLKPGGIILYELDGLVYTK